MTENDVIPLAGIVLIVFLVWLAWGIDKSDIGYRGERDREARDD